MRAAFVCLVALSLTGCATATESADNAVYPAKFATPPGNATREMIRRYVFDTLGTDYIADIDMLSRSDKMIARDRGRAIASGRPIIAPDVEFRLELVNTPDGRMCRLMPIMDGLETPVLILPSDTDCLRLSPVL